MNQNRTAEMPGCGRRWKTKNRFSIAAHEPLEIADAIPTFPQPRPRPPWKSGNPNPGFPLSHRSFLSLKIKNERRTQPPPVTLVFRLISGLENASWRVPADLNAPVPFLSDAVADGHADQIAQRLDVQLGHDIGAVTLGGPHAHVEFGGQFLVRLSPRQQAQDINFTGVRIN